MALFMFDVRLEAASAPRISTWIPSARVSLDVHMQVWELMRQRVATRACVSHHLVLCSMIIESHLLSGDIARQVLAYHFGVALVACSHGACQRTAPAKAVAQHSV